MLCRLKVSCQKYANIALKGICMEVGAWPSSVWRAVSQATPSALMEIKYKDIVVEKIRQEPKFVVLKRYNVRGSTWKLNLIARQIAWLPALEAVAQMQFSKKRRALEFKKLLEAGIRAMARKYSLFPEQLVVCEATCLNGKSMKRPILMARGRFGHGKREWSHIMFKVKEIQDWEAAKRKTWKYNDVRLDRMWDYYQRTSIRRLRESGAIFVPVKSSMPTNLTSKEMYQWKKHNKSHRWWPTEVKSRRAAESFTSSSQAKQNDDPTLLLS